MTKSPIPNRPELVAPAGTLEKLKVAVAYGADAVYFGGEAFNLRVQSGNLSPEEMDEALEICSARGVRTVFLLNAFLHEASVDEARRTIAALRHRPFDAVMVADPGMLALVRESGALWRIHLSTQMSTLNHLAVRFWREAGVSRIVLARETTLKEIRMIRAETDAELEVFAHGALCIAYSGRCLLSSYLTGRDANNGDCAQACRWRYSLMEEKRPGEYLDISPEGRATAILSSRDLCLIGRLPQYAAAGVTAFKIEGRMKSLYYTANVTRIYRHALESLARGDFDEHLPFYRRELDLVSHRPYTDELFTERAQGEEAAGGYVRTASFLGHVTAAGDGPNESLVKTANPLRIGDTIEAITPLTGGMTDCRSTITDIVEENGAQKKSVAMAQPGRIYRITFDREVPPDAVFRSPAEAE